ncbi:MAG: hisC [Paenibacillus sp.]|jgi:histidinol-phosphate aminotransferase|nr:hisC [Paenibacillus sp.]
MIPEDMPVKARKALNQITPYTPGKPIWEVKDELGLDQVIKLASNENPLGPSPKAIQAVTEQIYDLNRYPDASTANLKAALSSKLGLSADQFIVTNGADELITLVSEAFLEPGNEIIVTTPTFSEYEFGALLMEAKCISVSLGDNYGFNVDRILEAVTNNTKIVYICSPNNPTGTYLPKGELQRLFDNLPSKILVVYDAAYSHYATADDYTNGLDFIDQGYPILVLQTFSKIYGLAGLRVGFGAGHQHIISAIMKVKEPFNVNTLAQVAAAAALSDAEHVLSSQIANTTGRKRLYDAFNELGLHYTESMSNFILVELGPQAKYLYECLLHSGIIVRYGSTWGLPHHIRVTVGTHEENEVFIQKLTDLIKV